MESNNDLVTLINLWFKLSKDQQRQISNNLSNLIKKRGPAYVIDLLSEEANVR